MSQEKVLIDQQFTEDEKIILNSYQLLTFKLTSEGEFYIKNCLRERFKFPLFFEDFQASIYVSDSLYYTNNKDALPISPLYSIKNCFLKNFFLKRF